MYDIISYGADPTGTSDSSTAIQDAINACNSAGGGIVSSSTYGTFLVNNITLPDHVTLLGPLLCRGMFYAVSGKGIVFKNTHATNNTINAQSQSVGLGLESVGSSIQGISFVDGSGSMGGSHIYLPNGTDDIAIEYCSMNGGSHAINCVGSVYDVFINRNFMNGQTAATIRKEAAGGTKITMRDNFFRAGSAQAILFADAASGGGNELNWIIEGNTFAGYNGVGIAVICAGAYGVDCLRLVGNHFEANTGANSWNVYMVNESGGSAGSCHVIENNTFDNTAKGMQLNIANSKIGVNHYTNMSQFALNLTGSGNVIYPQTTGNTITLSGGYSRIGW